jgi:hypothetical protein
VSLLVPHDAEPDAWLRAQHPEGWSAALTVLLDAAGVRLEDVIVADEDSEGEGLRPSGDV